MFFVQIGMVDAWVHLFDFEQYDGEVPEVEEEKEGEEEQKRSVGSPDLCMEDNEG